MWKDKKTCRIEANMNIFQRFFVNTSTNVFTISPCNLNDISNLLMYHFDSAIPSFLPVI
jgi:hypothetical protein